MNIEEFEAWYLTLADSDRLIFLPLVIERLTIHGRAFGIDLAGEEQIKAFKGLNELQHLISFYFAGIGAKRDRYPDDVFVQALFEKASFYGLSHHLEDSLQYTRTRHNWGNLK